MLRWVGSLLAVDIIMAHSLVIWKVGRRQLFEIQNDSLVTEIDGRLAVLDTDFKDAVSCVEHVVKCSTVMDKSSHVPSILSAMATRSNLLRPSCDLVLPAHPIEELDYRRLRDAPAMASLFLSVFE